MGKGVEAFLTIGTAIIGVAIVAVILSRNSATVEVLGAAFGGFNEALKTAVSPITGGSA